MGTKLVLGLCNEIPSGLAQHRQSAESIDLHGNLMERFFGQDVGTASQLKALNLSYNLLKDDLQAIGNQVQEIDLTYNQLRYVMVPRDNPSCKYGSLGTNGLCCIQSSAPYADRVIRYNKRQHEALQNSSMHQQRGPNCANYKPSPCDGDDNKVYEVANAAANDVQSLVAQDKEALQGILNQQRYLLENKQNEKARIENENNQLQTTLNDLTGYIGKLYQDDGFKVPAKPDEQLKQIFTKRDADNKATLEQVIEEERKLQNLQEDIAKIEEELQDLDYRKERLLGDINARNATVVEHEKKIKELQEKIDKRG
ncbi:LRR Toll [Culex quinquefasciatus]|uniref:LRR Toll n=1 Tax=Culex quinquefasciatus TaxID=7176 RepID=B0WCL1_CULQU|nr:LRR Toll [Culex quinquefasciatus]|eukprot:XP_001846445.1 LRR Toll [Culex quinquefasciatus]